MTLLKRLGAALGLIEPIPVLKDGTPVTLVIAADDAFNGDIHTTRDVVVRGTVVGSIISPEKTVEIAEGGSVIGGRIWARRVIWRGQLGDLMANCEIADIFSSARTPAGNTVPTIVYERLNTQQAATIDVLLTHDVYSASLPEDSPEERSQDFVPG